MLRCRRNGRECQSLANIETARYTSAAAGISDFRRRLSEVIENNCSNRLLGLSRDQVGASEAGAKTSPPCASAARPATIQVSPNVIATPRKTLRFHGIMRPPAPASPASALSRVLRSKTRQSPGNEANCQENNNAAAIVARPATSSRL